MTEQPTVRFVVYVDSSVRVEPRTSKYSSQDPLNTMLVWRVVDGPSSLSTNARRLRRKETKLPPDLLALEAQSA